MNPCHNHFIPRSAARRQNLAATDLQTPRWKTPWNQREGYTFLSGELSRVSSSPVTESDAPSGASFPPLEKGSFFVKFHVVLHQCGWDRPRQNLHARTHTVLRSCQWVALVIEAWLWLIWVNDVQKNSEQREASLVCSCVTSQIVSTTKQTAAEGAAVSTVEK